LARLSARHVRLIDLRLRLLRDVYSHPLHGEVTGLCTSSSKEVGNDATYFRRLFNGRAAANVEVYLKNDEAECNPL